MDSQENKPTTNCSVCSELGTHVGHMFRMLPRVSPRKGQDRFLFKREKHFFCLTHYMENRHGLWPYRCTRACQRTRRGASQILLSPAQLIVWVGVEVILGKGNHPNCPWCGKPMKSAHPMGEKPR